MNESLSIAISIDCNTKTETVLIDTPSKINSFLCSRTPVQFKATRPLGTFLYDADASNTDILSVPFPKLQQIKFVLLKGESVSECKELLTSMQKSENVIVKFTAMLLLERCESLNFDTEKSKYQFATWFDDVLSSFTLYHRADNFDDADNSHLWYAKAICAHLPEDYIFYTSDNKEEYIYSSYPLALLSPYECLLKEKGLYLRQCCICRDFVITEKTDPYFSCKKEQCQKFFINETKKDRYKKNTERIPGELERLADYQAWYAKKIRYEKNIYAKLNSPTISAEQKTACRLQLDLLNYFYQEHIERSLEKRNEIIEGDLSLENYKNWLKEEKNNLFLWIKKQQNI